MPCPPRHRGHRACKSAHGPARRPLPAQARRRIAARQPEPWAALWGRICTRPSDGFVSGRASRRASGSASRRASQPPARQPEDSPGRAGPGARHPDLQRLGLRDGTAAGDRPASGTQRHVVSRHPGERRLSAARPLASRPGRPGLHRPCRAAGPGRQRRPPARHRHRPGRGGARSRCDRRRGHGRRRRGPAARHRRPAAPGGGTPRPHHLCPPQRALRIPPVPHLLWRLQAGLPLPDRPHHRLRQFLLHPGPPAERGQPQSRHLEPPGRQHPALAHPGRRRRRPAWPSPGRRIRK